MNSGKIRTLRWVYFISRRFAAVDKKGRSAVTSFLASLGIAFGVMTLITIVSVMNGFQMSYIDSILEISSAHIRVSSGAAAISASDEKQMIEDAVSFCRALPEVRTVNTFYEGQTLMASPNGHQSGALIRAVSSDIAETDFGFAKEAKLIEGRFDLVRNDSIVLGSELAYALGVQTGDSVTLLAMSGSASVSLIDDTRVFEVTGIFQCGYNDINASFAFVPEGAKNKLFGADAVPVCGIKLHNSASDTSLIPLLQQRFPSLECESWRSYNRAFFGALRVEKNMLMMLVFLIFVVVGVNIYNGMRRMVYERREEICIFSVLGGKSRAIQLIFIIQGFLTGFWGVVPGTALGLLISANIDSIFVCISTVSYQVQYWFATLFSPDSAWMIHQNMLYMVYASIPARIVCTEVWLIALFGIFSSLAAAWAASCGILRLSAAEVLRDE